MSEIKDIRHLLDQEAFKSSVRILILISLAINDKMYFMDLCKLTGIGKGSLSNHLNILMKSGYITDKTVFSIAGPRRLIYITNQGRQFYDMYIKLIGNLR